MPCFAADATAVRAQHVQANEEPPDKKPGSKRNETQDQMQYVIHRCLFKRSHRTAVWAESSNYVKAHVNPPP